MLPAMEGWSLNCWTARKVLKILRLNFQYFILLDPQITKKISPKEAIVYKDPEDIYANNCNKKQRLPPLIYFIGARKSIN